MSKKNFYFYISVICFVLLLNRAEASDLPYKEGELLVRFAPKANGIQRSIDEHNQILSAFNAGTVKKSMRLVSGLTVVKLPEGVSVTDALPKLKGKSEFLYVEPNYKIKLLSTFPNDPNFNQLWGLHNTGQPHPVERGGISSGTPDADIDAPEAWEITTDSDIIVAVIDTGVDYNHPDLAANMWVNPEEIPGDGNDNDHNGYVDDVYGYDFGGYTPQDQDGDPMDEDGHGTLCAGIIGAVGNNGLGVTGVCWSVKIMALKISPPDDLSEWEAVVSNAIEAIDYAVDKHANVINASWCIGANDSNALKDTIKDAGDAGVLFVAAAGNYSLLLLWFDNDAIPVYPASYDCNNIISVLATNDDDGIWNNSHYGANSVDLGAPGKDILSCVPGGGYEVHSGTSMAAPHVAGACALVWSMNRALSHLQVKNIILNSVDQKEALNGLCVTGGRLNLYNAVANTPRPTLNKVDDVDDGGSVLPYYEIIYTIYST